MNTSKKISISQLTNAQKKAVQLLSQRVLKIYDDDYDDINTQYHLNSCINTYQKDLKEMSVNSFEYTGELTIGNLLNTLADYRYEVADFFVNPKDLINEFIINFDYLRECFRDKKHYIKKYFWEEIHEKIKSVAKSKYHSKHYADAVESALKEVIKTIKDYTFKQVDLELDGDKLMNKVFGCENQTPVISVNKLLTLADKDEQKGLMYLYKGIVAIRNKKAHENVELNDPLICKEYLSLASLLMRIFEKSTSKLDKKNS